MGGTAFLFYEHSTFLLSLAKRTTMNFYLLDAAAGGLILGMLVLFMIFAILLEGVTLLLLKYNKAGKCFLDSFLVNIASLLVGLVIAQSSVDGLDITDNGYINVFLLFLITVVVEFVFLYLLNKKKPVSKTIIAAVLINVVSYLLFTGITLLFRNS